MPNVSDVGPFGRRAVARQCLRNDVGPALRPPRRRISHRAIVRRTRVRALGGVLVAGSTIRCQPYIGVIGHRTPKYCGDPTIKPENVGSTVGPRDVVGDGQAGSARRRLRVGSATRSSRRPETRAT